MLKSDYKIFCAKGNNGGDGLAIARMLSENGKKCEVFILEFGKAGTKDFQTNLSRLHGCPVEIHFLQHADFFPEIRAGDVIIDALYGTGLNRPLEELSAELVLHINNSAATKIAIDVPSGLFTDQPANSTAIINANHTLTFQMLKLCFMMPENEQFFGEAHVLDIGLITSFAKSVSSFYRLVSQQKINGIFKPRKSFTHKGTFGHALIIAGAKGKMGAAVLCCSACLRSGVGLVTAAVPESQFAIIQTSLPEAMAFSYDDMDELQWNKYSTVGIGPGLGTGEQSAKLVHKVLTSFNKPVVIDADALNIIAANRELLKELPPGSILSPHPKEFERLFGKVGNHFERIKKAKFYAKKLFVYIIVKGHHSVLACPDGKVYFNNTGNAGMATGGSGDVLTGLLSGLLAQGYASKESALLGMYLHGLAADIGVESISKEAFIAGDIVANLGKAFLTLKK